SGNSGGACPTPVTCIGESLANTGTTASRRTEGTHERRTFLEAPPLRKETTRAPAVMNDSKELWLNLRKKLPNYEVRIGSPTGQSYVHDPKHIAFVSSRYKFVAKMVTGCDTVLEVGCCDAFGGPIVAQEVTRLICTDIDEEMLQENV